MVSTPYRVSGTSLTTGGWACSNYNVVIAKNVSWKHLILLSRTAMRRFSILFMNVLLIGLVSYQQTLGQVKPKNTAIGAG